MEAEQFTIDVSPQKRVLIIEDEPEIAEIIVYLLTVKGLEAVAVSDGHQGLHLLNENKWDLVICDFNLPQLNGGEVCQRIKKSDTLKEIPVILMSGKMLEFEAQTEANLGAAAFLHKPFSIEVFYLLIMKLLNSIN